MLWKVHKLVSVFDPVFDSPYGVWMEQHIGTGTGNLKHSLGVVMYQFHKNLVHAPSFSLPLKH